MAKIKFTYKRLNVTPEELEAGIIIEDWNVLEVQDSKIGRNYEVVLVNSVLVNEGDELTDEINSITAGL